MSANNYGITIGASYPKVANSTYFGPSSKALGPTVPWAARLRPGIQGYSIVFAEHLPTSLVFKSGSRWCHGICVLHGRLHCSHQLDLSKTSGDQKTRLKLFLEALSLALQVYTHITMTSTQGLNEIQIGPTWSPQSPLHRALTRHPRSNAELVV